MTLVSTIITDAYRESNLIPRGNAPAADQQVEALRLLNRIFRSVIGNEAGDQLKPVAIGGNDINAPSGFPDSYNEFSGDYFVPANSRLVLNLEQSVTLNLHPQPSDGARLSVVDASSNLATYNLVINGNGRKVEGSASLTLSTDGTTDEWFFRADLGDWKKITSLALADEFPFPEEFDDMFIVMLAMRLNPRYSIQTDGQSYQAYQRSRTQFRNRYTQIIEKPVEQGLLRMTKQSLTDTNYGRYQGRDPNEFDRGFIR